MLQHEQGACPALCMTDHKALRWPLQVFLGTLRPIESEIIKDKLSSAIMESLLALTIFRDEFNGFFVAMFAGLVFVKVLHWLVQNRVDYIEVTPTVSRLQHVRIVSFMSFLLVSHQRSAITLCFATLPASLRFTNKTPRLLMYCVHALASSAAD